jgi:hypothetical protein
MSHGFRALIALLMIRALFAQDAPRSPVSATTIARSGPVPSDVRYTIIRTDITPGIKRSLDIRLNRKVSETVLTTIAVRLKSADHANYERTFILYYLPGMKVGEGAWASTHFDPDLKVEILGASIESEKTLRNHGPDRPSQDVIGKWIDEAHKGGMIISIYREGGKLYIQAGNSRELRNEAVEVPSSLGRRFQEKAGSDFGDHFIIDANGNLQLRDRQGFVRLAKKVG